MAGVGRTTNCASHSPPAVGRVIRCPAVGLAELLRSQLRDHRRDIRPPRTRLRSMSDGGLAALGRHQGVDGERGGVVRIIRVAACYAHGPVGARMPSDERNCTIDGADGRLWPRERAATPRARRASATDRNEAVRRSRCESRRRPPAVPRDIAQPGSASCARVSMSTRRRPPPSTRRPGGQRARSTARFRIAALVIATLPVMQW